MKFIVEHSDGETFAYFESEEQFKKTEEKRNTSLKRISSASLSEECKLYNDSYVVIDLPDEYRFQEKTFPSGDMLFFAKLLQQHEKLVGFYEFGSLNNKPIIISFTATGLGPKHLYTNGGTVLPFHKCYFLYDNGQLVNNVKLVDKYLEEKKK